MTIEEIEKRLVKIMSGWSDVEYQHMVEEKLYIDVLKAIADGIKNPSELAKKALEAQDIEYPR